MTDGSRGVGLGQCHVCAAAARFTFAEENFHLGREPCGAERLYLQKELSPFGALSLTLTLSPQFLQL